MEKKVTIRDVAREAGVSVATVSYVLNNRSDQKISAETKKKVLQIANLLQFTPSYAAKILTTGKSHIIGILPGASPDPDFLHIDFTNCLIRTLAAKGYRTMILPSLSESGTDAQPNIDGIICIDLTQEQFSQLSDSYLIPIVCADMIVDHYLFFQIYNDYAGLREKLKGYGQYTVLCNPPNNEKLKDFLSGVFGKNLRFCTDYTSVQNAVASAPAPYVTLGNLLTLCAMTLTDKDKILPVSSSPKYNLPVPSFFMLDTQKKAEATVQAMFDAMARNAVEHDLRISY